MESILGVSIGSIAVSALVTWLVARHYYRRAVADLRREYREHFIPWFLDTQVLAGVLSEEQARKARGNARRVEVAWAHLEVPDAPHDAADEKPPS